MATGVNRCGEGEDGERKESSRSPLVDPFVGNVSNLKVAPGPPEKGHLVFDACFESGNLGRVDYVNDFEYDLFIRPDTCNPRFRVWFHFSVRNVKSEQRVIFHVVNFSKTKSLYREGMSPLVKSTSRPQWQRIPAKTVFYYRSPEHHKNYVMSFAFAFDREDDTYEFAYSYPYTYSRLVEYLDDIEARGLDYFKREMLCLSVQQRRMDIITISSPRYLASKEKKRMVFITARVHPGETPSSYVCQGFIDFLVSSDPAALVLRDNMVFKIVPMLNPDGVFLGNYRCSLMGFDLNRHWHDPSPWAHPTLQATKSLVLEYDADPDTDLDFYIDIHAHSTLMNGFMYGNVYDDTERFDRHSVFPKLLCSNAPDFSMTNTSFNRDAVKAGTGRRFLGGCLDSQTNCYTLEVSFFSYTTGQVPSSPSPYTEEGYFQLGHNVAKTFLDYYRLRHFLRGGNVKRTSVEVPRSSSSNVSCEKAEEKDLCTKPGEQSDENDCDDREDDDKACPDQVSGEEEEDKEEEEKKQDEETEVKNSRSEPSVRRFRYTHKFS